MATDVTKLSSRGQVLIPKWLRDARDWQTGQKFFVVETDEGILLKPARPLPETALDEVAGSLRYEGAAKTVEEMDEAIKRGVRERHRDRR